MGMVSKVVEDAKGLVRSVLLRTQTSELWKPVNKLVLLFTTEERVDADDDNNKDAAS